MAPSRTFFVLLKKSDAEGNEYYAPICRDPKPYFLNPDGLTVLEPMEFELSDSEILRGTLLSGKPATVGDLRAGRASDIYWGIVGMDGEWAYMKTRSSVIWPEGSRPMDISAFSYRFVSYAETKGNVTEVVRGLPPLLLYARKFREYLLKKPKTGPKEAPKEAPNNDQDIIDSIPDAKPDSLVQVSGALYYLLTPHASKELASSKGTFPMCARTLASVSYDSLLQRVIDLGPPIEEPTVSSQASVNFM